MEAPRRILSAAPLAPLVGAGFVLAQVLRAAHRSDLPSFPNQEISGTFGDPDAPPLRIVAVGDSSLTAPGVEHLDNCWIRQNAIRLSERFRVEFVSLGVGGSKAIDVVEGQLHGAERLLPDLAVVSVGANDALRGVRPASFRRNLQTILERIGGASKATVVIGMGDLSSVPRLPPTLRPWVSRRSRLFDRISAEVAAEFERTVKVDTSGPLTTAFFDDPRLFAPDLFHVGDDGHAVFTHATLPYFEEALRMAGVEPG
jgi:lysophospholipase L1-like esterase